MDFDSDIELGLEDGDFYCMCFTDAAGKRHGGLQLAQQRAVDAAQEMLLCRMSVVPQELQGLKLNHVRGLTLDVWHVVQADPSGAGGFYDFFQTQEQRHFTRDQILWRIPAYLAQFFLYRPQEGMMRFRFARWMLKLVHRIHEQPIKWRRARFLGLPAAVKRRLEEEPKKDMVPDWLVSGLWAQQRQGGGGSSGSSGNSGSGSGGGGSGGGNSSRGASSSETKSREQEQARGPDDFLITKDELGSLIHSLTACAGMASDIEAETRHSPSVARKAEMLRQMLAVTKASLLTSKELLPLTGPFGV